MKVTKLDPDDLNLMTLAQDYSDNESARSLFEELLWPDGPVCPHCKNCKEKPIYSLKPAKGSKSPARKGVYKCGACRKQFTVTVGTIFEDSHIPLGKWLMAIFILCSSKKAISAHQLHRMLGITYRSAWFMAHRLRFAMGPKKPLGQMLKGVVEVDEGFIGGKGDRTTKPAPKTPVVALIEQGGQMRTKVISSVSASNLKKCLNEFVSKDATLCTDEHPGYKQPGKEYKLHYSVNHSKAEFERREKDGTLTSTNHCESFFSLLKRGIHGSWHHVSKEHLPKYCDEFSFRWNTRELSDGARMSKAFALTPGKRLTYRQVA
jgi:transposase-like protein